jgi:hypothetical protein
LCKGHQQGFWGAAPYKLETKCQSPRGVHCEHSGELEGTVETADPFPIAEWWDALMIA